VRLILIMAIALALGGALLALNWKSTGSLACE
jgi:hypothetical protein